jgi:hypothetical protein
MNRADLAADEHAAAEFDAWLDRSMAAAHEVAEVVSDQFSDREDVTVSADLRTDGPDDPTVAFVIRLAIADDFDVDEWPDELVADVTQAIRTRAVEELPPTMPFYVIVNQRTPSQAA